MNKEFLEELENDIKRAATTNLDTDEAERLAAKFLLAQLEISRLLRPQDLDARLGKTSVKERKANVYLDEVRKSDKKPSDVLLEQVINTNEGVLKLQEDFDRAEVDRDSLQDHLNVFKEAHIYFRGLAKGKFGD